MENNPDLDDFDKAFGPQNEQNVTPPPPVNDLPPPPAHDNRPHSGAGMASLWLGVGYIFALMLGAMIQGGGFIVLALLGLLCNILGLIFGIIGLSQKEYKRGYAVAGTIINSILLLALVMLVMYIFSEI